MPKKSADCHYFDYDECSNSDCKHAFKKVDDTICNDCYEFITEKELEKELLQYKCKKCNQYFDRDDELSIKIGISKIHFYSEDDIDEIDTFRELCQDCYKLMIITNEDIDKFKLILKDEPKLLEKIEKIKNCFF